MNTKQQGDIGVAKAIYYYSSKGYTVSIPNTDNARYDLIVDREDQLHRIQVKTSTHKVASGSYEVQLRTMGGNQSWSGTVKKISTKEVDYIFIVCENGNMYEIPSEVMDGRSTVTLGKDYILYKVELDRW